MRKKFTMLLMSLLCCVGGAKAANGDAINVADGYYTLQCNGNNKFANYNKVERIVPIDMGRFPTSVYYLTKGEKGYTIQTSDGKFVTYKGTGKGDQIAIVDETDANDNNKWWVIREGNDDGVVTVVPFQSNIAETAPGWNYSVEVNGVVNAALGLYDCTDGNSQWLLKSAAFMAEGQAYIKCAGNYIVYKPEGVNGAYFGKTSNKNDASIFNITPNGDGKYTIKLNEQFVIKSTIVKLEDANEPATNDNKWWVIAPNVTSDKSTGGEVDIIASQDNIGRSTNAWNFANHDNGSNSGLAYWSASDGGSKCEIEWIPINITYNYNLGDVVKYTEEVDGYAGHFYPAPTVVLPLGVSVTDFPEEKITTESGNKVDLSLNVKLPFEYAENYEAITKWYYLTIHATKKNYLYYEENATSLDASKTAVDAANKDAYTWAFVGNPFDGFSIVNKLADKGYVLTSTEPEVDATFPVVAEGTQIWDLYDSEYGTDGFFVAYDGTTKRLNRQNHEGLKVCYWLSGADAGSTFMVEERDMSGAAELQVVVDEAEALVASLGNVTTVGCVTSESLAAVNEAIAAAKTAVENKTGCDAAQVALESAIDALETIQPEEGKFYTIVSAHTDYANGQSIYVHDDGPLKFSEGTDASKYFQFIKAENGYYLYNVKTGKYLSTANAHNGGQEKAEKASVDGAKCVVITNMGKANIVQIVPVGGAMIHAQRGGDIVAWDNSEVTGASAWTIVEVENPGVAIVGNEDYATLQEAIGAVSEENTTVKLIESVELASYLTVSKDVTLNLNGKNITGSGTAFYVTGGTLTIEGTGAVSAANGTSQCAVWAAGGKVVINGGTFSVGVDDEGKTNSCIYSTGGEIAINGGDFSNAAGTYGGGGVFNVKNELEGAKITINSVASVTVGDGSVIYETEDRGKGLIVDNRAITSEELLKLAIAAGGEVTLGGDITLTSYLTVSKDVTLNLNGKSITGSGTAFYVTGGTLTIEGTGAVSAANGTSQCAVWAAGGKVVINGGTFSVGVDDEGKTNSCIYSTGGEIAINGGDFSNAAGTYGGGGVFNVKNELEGAKITINSVASVTVGEGSVIYETEDRSKGLIVDNRAITSEELLKLAIAAGDEVTLGGDIVLTSSVAITKNVTINLNGNNISRAEDFEGYAFEVTGELTANGDGFIEDNSICYIINDADYKTEAGKSYTLTSPKEGVTVTYKRTFGHTNWQVLFVPFEIPLESMTDFEVYTITGVNSERVTVEEVTEGTLSAHTPYLIKAKEIGEKTITATNVTLEATKDYVSEPINGYTFTGIYTSEAIAAHDKYVLTDGKWCRLSDKAENDGNNVLGAFRVYLTAPNGTQANALSITRGETGIEELSTVNDQQSTVIYDLTGRKVETMDKGIYIVNGRKVVIK